jgi:hypothetical protein
MAGVLWKMGLVDTPIIAFTRWATDRTFPTLGTVELTASLVLVISMTNHVDHHGACEDKNVVLPVSDFHSVGVRPRKPPFGNGRHGSSATGKAVFMIEEVLFRLQVVRAGHIDRERAVE